MHMRNVFLAAGTLLPLLGTGVYVVSILRGISKPHRMTRLLLTVITGLSFFALLAGHDTSGVWLALVSFVQAIGIYLLSLKYGMGGRDTFDFICMALCTAGLAAWWVTGESLSGLLASILADLVAVLPSLRKTWRLPHTEDGWFYAIDTIAAALIVIAGPYHVSAVLFPGYIFGINAVFAVAVWRGRLLRGLRTALNRHRARSTGRLRYRRMYEPDND